jgi:hypothetical protein
MTDPAAVKLCPSPEHEGPNPLPVTGFTRNRAYRDGLHYRCRACDNRAARAGYAARNAPWKARQEEAARAAAAERERLGLLPDRPGRYLPRLWALASYWAGRDTFAVSLDRPHCFGCRLRMEASGVTPQEQWNSAGLWLHRAHLVDRIRDGLDGPQNVVPLCAACNHVMPSFGPADGADAIAWVQAGGSVPYGSAADRDSTSWLLLRAMPPGDDGDA